MSSAPKVVAKECRFAIHIPTRTTDVPDLHLIKEQLHFEDGTSAPNIRFIKNYERSFYVTRKSQRNHHSKKEWEQLDNLDKFTCTQSELRYRVATALEKPWSRDSLKVLSQSPYLYGTDITSTALIKHGYKKRYPDKDTGFTTAIYDIETDVLFGTDDVIVATLIFKNKIFTVATEFFMKGYPGAELLVQNKFDSLLGDFIKKRNLELEFKVVASPAQAVIEIFNKAHQWQPDFLAAWNIDFDIPRSILMLEKEGIDAAQALSDPRVPPAFRRCQYKQGNKKKITASGRVIPINPSSQWHTLYLTASFYVIDAMCVYKLLRTPPAQEEPSYSLEYILNKEMGYGKLKFTEADQYSHLQWHEVMQTKFKIEYIIYNIFDCLGVLEMNDKTKDLSHSMPAFAGVTDFEKYNSNPRKIHDAIHFFCLERELVVSASGSMQKTTEENDNIYEIDYSEEGNLSEDSGEEEEAEYDTLNLKGWIITLPAHLTENNGLCVIAEDENLHPNVRGYTYDSDSVAAYPSATMACNVSKETTKKEISSIEGIAEPVFRLQNINLLYGSVNAVEYCTEMFGFPTLLELEKLIEMN